MHRLITRGAAVESVAQLTKVLTETEFYAFAKKALTIPVLSGQTDQFCRRYCLFIFRVNGIVPGIYLCSWQIIHGGIGLVYMGTVLLFSLQRAILSVILEWKHPIRGWKTESDLWHHPRKYLVPLAMRLMAAIVAHIRRSFGYGLPYC